MDENQSPQILDEDGKHLYQKGEFLKAANKFAEASVAFNKQGDELMAAEEKNNQCVALLKSNRAQAALDAVTGTDVVFEKNGDFRRQGISIANLGSSKEALKEWDVAARYYERAADLLEKEGEDQLRADVLKSLAALNARKGKGLDALIAMQDGLSGVKEPTLKQKILKKLLRIRLW